MRRSPSGLVTFLFTDIERSTWLWERQPHAMKHALALHDHVVRDTVVARAGVVFATTGDGVAAAFRRASDAVAAALEAQHRLRTALWPDGVALAVRMGLNTGVAVERHGNYFGSPVNRAARVMAAAGSGQVLVSEATASHVARLPAIQLVDLGHHRLRGIDEQMRLYGVHGHGLDWVDHPSSDAAATRVSFAITRASWVERGVSDA